MSINISEKVKEGYILRQECWCDGETTLKTVDGRDLSYLSSVFDELVRLKKIINELQAKGE